MVALPPAIAAVGAVAGAVLSFFVYREQRMLRADEAEAQVERRTRDMRYACDWLGVNLKRVYITEQDSAAYELRRMFLLGSIQGESEILYALEDISTGEDASMDAISLDEDRLRELLGDVLDEASIGEIYGNTRLVVKLNTADPDLIEEVSRLLPYHLLGRDEESDSYEDLLKRKD